MGQVTRLRLTQLSYADIHHQRAINRIRHYYLDAAPEAARYLTLPAYDDLRGIGNSAGHDVGWVMNFLPAAQMVAVGAVPVVVAWPDLPASLQRGRLDGLLTTHETIASAQLWQHGIRNATEIKAYFAQYIPLISTSLLLLCGWQDYHQPLKHEHEDFFGESP